MSSLRLVSLVSGVYDVLVGVVLLAVPHVMATAFGVPPPQPPVFADTNGLFLVVIGLGYALPWRDPGRWRAYLWLMGPLLKGAGALVFLRDYALRDSPASFLLFAASDGTLALWTLVVLMRTRRGRV